MNILIDTNVVLDVLLDREPFVEHALKVWTLCESRTVIGFLSASAITDIFYIARRMTDVATARVAVELCLATFQIAAINQQTVEFGFSIQGDDFEDDLQIAVAMQNHFDAIVTRNTSDYGHAQIAVYTPQAFLAEFLV